MLKDLAIETAISAGLFSFFFLFATTVRSSFTSKVVPLLFFCVLGFLGLAIFQLRKLLDGGKTKHVVAFIAILMATIIITSVIVWMWSGPVPIDPGPFVAGIF
jgi:hypothetical protein